jgi:hypothetical protein
MTNWHGFIFFQAMGKIEITVKFITMVKVLFTNVEVIVTTLTLVL